MASAAPLLGTAADRAVEQARTLLDAGQFEPAQQFLQPWLRKPHTIASLPFLRLRALLYQHQQDFIAEAATYHDILHLAPDDSEALRGRVWATQRLGAPHLAATFAGQHAELFSAAEMYHLQQTVVGKNIAWGQAEIQAGRGPQRFQLTDRAMEQNAALHGAAHDLQDSRASFDRIVVLRDRVRMDEAIALYQELLRQQVQVPAAALAAVAEAYLYNRQPERARDLYLQALTLSKNDPDYPNRVWQFGLFEAYLDANAFAAARQLSEQLEQDIPPILYKGLPGVERDNDFYANARVNTARVRLAANALGEGQSMLETLLRQAPFHIEARLAYGDLLQAREQPRAAQNQYTSVFVDDPSNLYAAVGLAETALELHDVDTAKTQVDVLLANYPENRAVQRVQRQLTLYQGPLLTLAAETGRSASGSGNTGNNDWQLDTFLYSPLFATHWRLLAHIFYAQADFDDATARRQRLGLGADYRALAWQISAELNHDATKLGSPGISLRSTWSPNDHWRLEVEFDSQSNDVPLRASAADIDAVALTLQATYTHNESRHFSANLGQVWFSDHNRRLQASARWSERWYSGPRYTLETQLSADTSANSRADTVYFNPHRDYSLEFTVSNEWRLWQHYERQFNHRLTLAAGQYWQQGFDGKATFALRYEQAWHVDSARVLRYGIGYSYRPFDGVYDKRLAVFLEANWSF